MSEKTNWTIEAQKDHNNIFSWTSIAKLDDRNRFVLKKNLYKDKLGELFLVLAESNEFGKYIKILEEFIINENNPLKCDSLKLATMNRFRRVELCHLNRISLNNDEIKRLFGLDTDAKELTCIWLGNHVAITAKTKEEIFGTIS